MIVLKERQIEFLRRAPESGMGFQWVELRLRKGAFVNGTAFNAEVVLLEGEPRDLLQQVVAEPEIERAAERLRLPLQSADEIEAIRVGTRTWEAAVVRETTAEESGPADEAPARATSKLEQFKRFSAFLNDRRVTAKNGLLPGTYATTAADATHVQTGSQAVARYALPNPTPAVHRFTIDPPVGVVLQRGIVQAKFGQPGGGVEVIFTCGSPDKTVTLPPDIIPP